MIKLKRRKPLAIADLFAGAGGTSTGAVEAIRALGYEPKLTAINHWDVAIATHTKNHPDARHFCTSIDDINPKKLFKEDELEILWASPECTHHSTARGGKPINDQSRATAWCVVRWAEALRPRIILVENVPEFETWGPIGSNGRPLKSRKGEVFQSWVKNLEALGYKVSYQVLSAANYGDPTTRRRLFVQAVRGKLKIVWPNAVRSQAAETDLFGSRKAWRTARDHVIDWSIPGKSIYDRKRPLSAKTIRRIWAGLEKFGLAPFVVPQQSNPTPKSVDEPLGTVVADGSGAKLVQPFFIAPFGERKGQDPRVLSVDAPMQTVTAQKGGPSLVQPFIIAMEHGGFVDSIEKPLRTISCAKGGAMAVADPFLVKLQGTSSAADINKPAPTVTASGGHLGVAHPFLVPQHSTNGPRSVDKPAPTITTTSRGMGLAEPVLVKVAGAEDRPGHSVDKPMPTVTAGGVQHGLAQAFLVHTAHADDRPPLDPAKPLPTVTGNRGDIALVEPFVMSAGGPNCPARPVSQPLGTVLTRDHRALVEPTLIPQGGGGAARPVSEPVPTVACDGAIGLAEPFLVQFYGNSTEASSVLKPLATVTTKDRHGLVRPIVVIKGERYLLDIRFRMLQPHELAAAQGFRRDYKFTGNKTQQVKQIGNAVPRRMAKAILLAVLTQNPDVAALLEADDDADVESKVA